MFFNLLFLLVITLSISWSRFPMFIVLTFFLVSFGYDHLVIFWLWFLTFITIACFSIPHSHDYLAGFLVMVLDIHRHHLFPLILLVLISLLVFWLWFLMFIIITFSILLGHDRLVGLLVMILGAHHHGILFYSSWLWSPC